MIMKTTYQGAIEIKATIMRVMEPSTGMYARTPEEIANSRLIAVW